MDDHRQVQTGVGRESALHDAADPAGTDERSSRTWAKSQSSRVVSRGVTELTLTAGPLEECRVEPNAYLGRV